MRRGRGGGGGGGGGAWRRPTAAKGSATSTPVVPDRTIPRRPRDSDASICSSRPSSVSGYGSAAPAAVPPQSNAAMLRSVNAYLDSHSFGIVLKPLPSARDITETVRFIITRVDYPLSCSNERLIEDELPQLLKFFGCPFKLTKSALKAPGTPHAWPSFITALHWLVQLARYFDHLSSSPPQPTQDHGLISYIADSFSLFISGEDDAVQALDEEHMVMCQQQVNSVNASMESLEKEASELEFKLQAMRSGPTPKEVLVKERADLLEDVEKFRAIIDSFNGKVNAMEEAASVKEKELEVKEGENQRICEENEELRKRIELQTVNVWDVERMQKEIQAVERDIAEAEMGRSALEEKVLELDASIRRKFMELMSSVDHCNEAIRKLKVGNGFQYILNAEGSSPSEVLGSDYKTLLKTSLKALAEDMKKGYVAKMEEMIALQKQSQESDSTLKFKRNSLASIHLKIDKAEAQVKLLKREIEDHASLCNTEGERIKTEVEGRVSQLELVEKEADEFLKDSELILQDSIKRTDEQIQICASEVVSLIDLISIQKEYMESTISGMKEVLSNTAKAVVESHKASLNSKISAAAEMGLTHCGVKRVRLPSPDTIDSSSSAN